jgi:hypothetical protein
MRNRTITTLSIAAVSFALALPIPAQSTTAPLPGTNQAMRMVPAQVALENALDATKAAPGFQFRAIVSTKVRLDSGAELPRGTALLGTVSTDDMNANGTSKLALRFTQAVLKDGTTIPIKATIVGAYRPNTEGNSEVGTAPGTQVPNNWNDGTLKVDQIGVAKDVDLHSSIASQNSGVFVAAGNHVVKLPAGSELALAIAQQTPRQIAQDQ